MIITTIIIFNMATILSTMSNMSSAHALSWLIEDTFCYFAILLVTFLLASLHGVYSFFSFPIDKMGSISDLTCFIEESLLQYFKSNGEGKEVR